jgi:hypothetical protein
VNIKKVNQKDSIGRRSLLGVTAAALSAGTRFG